MVRPLQSAVVVVNQFSVKSPDGSGSRGATPGKYVTRYMARDLATEPVTPIRMTDMEPFINRYMLRAGAVDHAVTASSEVGSDTESPIPPRPRTSSVTDVESQSSATGDDDTADDPVPGVAESAGSRTLAARRAERRAARAAKREQDARKRRAARRSEAGSASADVDPEEIKGWFRDGQGKGGLAFGYGEVSLSHEKLMSASADIQRLFDKGHTALKTVLSFDHDYLRSVGVVPADMDQRISAGDYRGQLDQLKLRRAITHGLERMGRRGGYDDLRYVGVIQVDTEHVHCHLVMVDAGDGIKAVDGTQKGKLSQESMSTLRRGIDSVLDEQKAVAFLASAVDVERRNVLSYIKRWAYESMSWQSTPQFVLAMLPENKNLWRASTNRVEMRRPNELVRKMVEERLARPGSPMDAAMARVRSYADGRVAREGLSTTERDRLVDTGRRQIIDRCVNGVYRVLAQIPETEKVEATPLMATMATQAETLQEAVVDQQESVQSVQSTQTQDQPEEDGSSGQLSTEEFSLRLRAYSARLDEHTRLRQTYRLKAQGWGAENAAGRADASSRVMHDFYRSEEDYHAMCQSKYRHFMRFTPPQVDWQSDWDRVEDYGHRLTGLKALRADRSIAAMADPSAAESLGRELYDQQGGYELAAGGVVGRRMLDERVERMENAYAAMVDEVRSRASAAGVSLVAVDPEDAVTDTDTDHRRVVLSSRLEVAEQVREPDADIHTPGVRVAVVDAPEHDFTDVRGVDLHDMSHEWLVDQKVGDRVLKDVTRVAELRRQAIDNARVWMQETQLDEEIVDELGEADEDVTRMENTLEQVVADGGVLRSGLAEHVRRTRVARQARQAAQQAEQTEGEVDVEPVETREPVTPGLRTVPLRRQIARSVHQAVDEGVRGPGE